MMMPLHEKVMDHVVTVIKNKREIVPIKELENKNRLCADG